MLVQLREFKANSTSHRLYNSWDGSMFEDHEHVHLDKKRWYPGTSRLSDGSMIVVGGTDNNINYNLNPT